MKQNVSPVVTGVIVAVVVGLLIFWGFKATGPQHEKIDKPIDMGKMMGGANAGPPPGAGRGGIQMAPASSGTSTPP